MKTSNEIKANDNQEIGDFDKKPYCLQKPNEYPLSRINSNELPCYDNLIVVKECLRI